MVLLDERAARDVAKKLALPVRGTLGLLAEAKRRGLISAVRPAVEGMLGNGIHLAPELVRAVLAGAGE